MNQKFKITQKVLEAAGIDASDSRVKKTIPTWWANPRKKENGGLRLTEQGFKALTDAGIKSHKVKFEENKSTLSYSNQQIIWFDRLIDCPWFINHKEIYVFNDKMAVQLILFSGNVERFTKAKADSLKSS